MKQNTFTAASALLAILIADVCVSAELGPWPQWRGPRGDNHASSEAIPPRTWNLQTGEGILWKTAIPGRGHCTPIVIPSGIYLTTADSKVETQSVIKIDPSNGNLERSVVLHRGTLPDRIHPNNSHASPSMAYDGDHLFALFHTNNSLVLTALTTDLQTRWQTKVCAFKPSAFQFGFGASPIVEGDLVIVAGEYDGPDSGIYAIDRRTGKQVWKIPRPANLNFATAIVAEIAGQRQLLVAGADVFCSYDPVLGKELWRVDTTTEAICGTVVWDDRRVMVSGGNPVNGTWCVGANGRGEVLWSNPVMCYEQSLLSVPNAVFAVADNGVAYCWQTRDGKEKWRKRLFGGGISASPLLADNRIIVATQRGEIIQLVASPDRFELVSSVQTGNSIFATPVAIGNRLYVRTGIRQNGTLQEYLVAIGH